MAEAATATMDTIAVRVSDVSGQKTVKVSAIPVYATVGELVNGLLVKMGLRQRDPEGRPMQWRARLERQGRHLNGAELVGDALVDDDFLTLQPDINAGAW